MSKGRESHYEFGEWADFARAVVDSKAHKKMLAHLEGGCKQCGKLAEFFANVVERAAADNGYSIPHYALRNIHAIYALRQPQEVRLLPRTLARLVYDSFREPLLAGVRSQQSAAHQLMYAAGPYTVDLRLEHEQGAPQVRLTGQIANRERGSGVPEVPVFLLSRDLVIGKTTTNQFGEFAVEYSPSNALRLFAPIPGENHIEVRFGAASSRRRGATKK